MQPEFQDREARLRLMDRQGIESAILLPSLGVCVEHSAIHSRQCQPAADRGDLRQPLITVSGRDPQEAAARTVLSPLTLCFDLQTPAAAKTS